MQRLWAPWRADYLRQIHRPARGCLFCTAARARLPRRHWVLRKTRWAMALLNLYPYTPGHLMVAPRRHVGKARNLRPAEHRDIWALTMRMEGVLQRAVRPDGLNIGMNIGRAAGAGVPGHLHVHLVPRWMGDVNFMPVLANTKVMSEGLEACYAQLRTADTRSL